MVLPPATRPLVEITTRWLGMLHAPNGCCLRQRVGGVFGERRHVGCRAGNANEGLQMDIVLASSWRNDGISRFVRGGGGHGVNDSHRDAASRYVWRKERYEIVVERDGESWHVSSTSSGRLFGPREVLYEARHRQAKHAAWDVMACVIRASRNEDEGVNAGRDAAKWMVGQRASGV
jgi:hypothetical protein